MKKLIILIVAIIFLASCATAPVRKTETPAPAIAAEEIETIDTDQEPTVVSEDSKTTDIMDPAMAETEETEPVPESDATEKIRGAATSVGAFFLWCIDAAISAGAIW